MKPNSVKYIHQLTKNMQTYLQSNFEISNNNQILDTMFLEKIRFADIVFAIGLECLKRMLMLTMILLGVFFISMGIITWRGWFDYFGVVFGIGFIWTALDELFSVDFSIIASIYAIKKKLYSSGWYLLKDEILIRTEIDRTDILKRTSIPIQIVSYYCGPESQQEMEGQVITKKNIDFNSNLDGYIEIISEDQYICSPVMSAVRALHIKNLLETNWFLNTKYSIKSTI